MSTYGYTPPSLPASPPNDEHDHQFRPIPSKEDLRVRKGDEKVANRTPVTAPGPETSRGRSLP